MIYSLSLNRLMATFLFSIALFSPLFGDPVEVILTPDDNSDYDTVWTTRYKLNVHSWGIVGNHIEGTNGSIWWDNFPGPAGVYHIYLGAVTEPDGDSPYKLYINNDVAATGRYPYSTGTLQCEKSELALEEIDLGEHEVPAGAQIRYWASSVYPCGSSHGQYSRFYQIKFVYISSTVEDDTPPPPPTNLTQTASTNTSATLSWNASSDPQSGIAQYKVFFDTILKTRVSGTEVTIGGLTRHTTYKNVTITALNGKLLESAPSVAITVTTADNAAPANTLYFKPSDGRLSNGMQRSSDVNGSLSGTPVYAEGGSSAQADSQASQVHLAFNLPAAGTWYAWGRSIYQTDGANSFWLQIDDTPAQRFINGRIYAAWHWEGAMQTPLALPDLTKGPHTLTIYGREPAKECLLDALCLTQDASYIPDDDDVSFTPITMRPITLLSPTASTPFQVGDTMHIRWETDESTITDVDIIFSPDNGKSVVRLNAKGSITLTHPQWGNYLWPVSRTVSDEKTSVSTLSSSCRIIVAQYGSKEISESDISDIFTISDGQGGVEKFISTRTENQSGMDTHHSALFSLRGQRLAHFGKTEARAAMGVYLLQRNKRLMKRLVKVK